MNTQLHLDILIYTYKCASTVQAMYECVSAVQRHIDIKQSYRHEMILEC